MTPAPAFTPAERACPAARPLARLATTGPDGGPRVRPVGVVGNEDDTIDIGGPALSRSRKYRNGRGVEVRGRAEVLTLDAPPMAPDFFSAEVIRIHPRRVIGRHLEPDDGRAHARNVTAPRVEYPYSGARPPPPARL
ncbi:PNPOx family protein [Streptomyces sp. YKOK-I1]